MSTADVLIDELLDDLGYRDVAAKRAARAVLEAAGLTNGRKMRIAASKLEVVMSTLAAKLVIVCSRATCRDALVGDPRTVMHAARATDCAICSGSQNHVTIERAVAVLAHRGWRRIVVVGGSPGTRQALAALVGSGLDLRLVSGTDRRTSHDAKADLAWADIVIVWGSTELDHRVSKLYTDVPGHRVVTCARRGVAAVATTLITAAQPSAR